MPPISYHLEQTYAFMSAAEACDSGDAIAALVVRQTAALGVENILAGIIPTRGMLVAIQMRHVMLSRWPQDWARRYFERGYLFRDPTIIRVLKTEPPFAWSELTPSPAAAGSDLIVMNEARDFALNDGWTVPLISLESVSSNRNREGIPLSLFL